jgi:hypothetical protein
MKTDCDTSRLRKVQSTDQSEALERRLRELWDDRCLDDVPEKWRPALYRIMRTAARIGAEIEREECAKVIDRAGFRLVAESIRQRVHPDERRGDVDPVLTEREACAAIAEVMRVDYPVTGALYRGCVEAAIRARGGVK